jgi:hypothetical protein
MRINGNGACVNDDHVVTPYRARRRRSRQLRRLGPHRHVLGRCGPLAVIRVVGGLSRSSAERVATALAVNDGVLDEAELRQVLYPVGWVSLR